MGAGVAVSALVVLAACGGPSASWQRTQDASFLGTQTNFFVNEIETGVADGSWLVGGYRVMSTGVRVRTVWF